MSTKIFNAYRFATSDLWAIHDHCMKLQKTIQELQYRNTCGHLAWEAANLIDRQALGLATNGGSAGDDALLDPTRPLTSVRRDLADRRRIAKQEDRRDSDIDLDFTLMVLPFQGSVYARLFTVQPSFRKAFEAAGLVEPFGYWDSEDPPEGVNGDAWEARRRLWDDLLAQDDDRTVGCGFSVVVAPPFRVMDPEIEDVLAEIPDLETRVEHQAKPRVLKAHADKRVAARGGGEERVSDYVSAYDHIRTEAGRAELSAAMDEVRPLLAKEITETELLDGWAPTGAASLRA